MVVVYIDNKEEIMKVKYGQKITSLFLCLVLIAGLLSGLTPVAYAEETEQGLPTIHEPDGFTLNSAYEAATTNVKVPVYSSIDAEAPQSQLIPFTITVENYDEPIVVTEGEKVKAGVIKVSYGDLLAAKPTKVQWKRSYYDLAIDGEGTKWSSGTITLTNGTATPSMIEGPMQYDESGQATNTILILYDIKVFGNNLVANHPSDWSYDAETKTFTINSDTYISEYKSYTLTNKLLPTWGTTMDKDTVDFSQGPAKVTLTNTIGTSEEYTIKLVMPWQLQIPGKSGYNITTLKSGEETIAENVDLEELTGAYSYDVFAGKTVELTIAPYGENEGKVIDTIAFLDETDSVIEVEDKVINGNTVSFKMPEGSVRIGEVTFKEEQASTPSFAKNSLILSGKLGVNFFMDLSMLSEEERSASYVEFTVNNERTIANYDPNYKNTTGEYYGFVCYINSVQMAEIITAEYHYGDGKTVTKEYSVKEYMGAFDENRSLFDSKTIAVVESVANYGHYIQPFLSNANHWTIGEDFALMDKYYATSYDINSVKSAVADYEIIRTTNADIEKITYALRLVSGTEILVYFKPVEGYTGTVTFTVDGATVTPIQEGDRYLVKITDINANQLGDTHTVNAITANGTATAKVSALSYVKGMLDAYTDSDSQNAAAALYEYYLAAHNMKEN